MTEELDGPTRRGPTRAHAPPRPFRVPLNPVNAQSFAALPARGQAVEHLKDSRSRSAHPGRARLLARIQRGERKPDSRGLSNALQPIGPGRRRRGRRVHLPPRRLCGGWPLRAGLISASLVGVSHLYEVEHGGSPLGLLCTIQISHAGIPRHLSEKQRSITAQYLNDRTGTGSGKWMSFQLETRPGGGPWRVQRS